VFAPAESSIAIGLRPVPGAPLLAGDDLAATLAAAAAAGFGSVELLLGSSEDAPELGVALRDAGLRLRGLLSGPIRAVDGLSLGDPATAAAAARRVEALIAMAAPHGADVVLGWVLGGAAADPSTLVGSLRRCRDAARAAGVGLLVEPVNRYEDPVVRTAAEASELIDNAGGGLMLLLDLFHMSIEEADPPATLRRFARRAGHIHVADSNRRPPGEGHLPLAGWLRELPGFDGTVGIEAVHDGQDARAAAARAAGALTALGQAMTTGR
jgi:sugar phosphate isomerase/epimerase